MDEADGPKELTLIPGARLEAPLVIHGLSSAAIARSTDHDINTNPKMRVCSVSSKSG